MTEDKKNLDSSERKLNKPDRPRNILERMDRKIAIAAGIDPGIAEAWGLEGLESQEYRALLPIGGTMNADSGPPG